MTVLFWSSLGALLYVYFGYPLLMWIISRFGKKRSSPKAPHVKTCQVTVLVPAFNEEKVISSKLDNCLSLDYPAGLLDILVISDASDDRTDEIVSTYTTAHPDRVSLLRMPERSGKTAGINAAMQVVTSEVTVFTDANVVLHADAINAVVEALKDERVGGVAGQLSYVNESASDSASGNGLYWRYEEFIKRCEGKNGSLMGADGSIFAIKSSMYRELPEHVMDDFCTSMGIVMGGHIFAFDASIRAFEKSAEKPSEEFQRKVRIANRSHNSFLALSSLGKLSAFDTWKFVSHKLLRWYSFVFLAICLSSNLAIALDDSHPFYSFLLIMQVAGYALATLKFLFPALQLPFLNAWYYFVMANTANGVGISQSWMGKKTTIWQPAISGR